MNIDDLNPFTTNTSFLSETIGIGGSGSVSTMDIKKRKTQLLTKRYLTEKDAYVTGFFYATIDSVPPAFIDYMVTYYPLGNWTEDNIIEIFSSSITEVQLPAETLKTLQFNGRGGHTVTSPLFSQKGNTITIQFLADQNMQITALLMGWYDYISKINDGRYDVSGSLLKEKVVTGTLSDYESSSNIYGANFYYGTLLPDMTSLTFGFAAEGLFPTIMPINDMSHTVGQHDALRHSVTFSVDYYDFWVKSRMDTYWLYELLSGKVKELGDRQSILDMATNSTSNVGDFKYKYEGSAEDKFNEFAFDPNANTVVGPYDENSSFQLAHTGYTPPASDRFNEVAYDTKYKTYDNDNFNLNLRSGNPTPNNSDKMGIEYSNEEEKKKASSNNLPA
jgi:hypothetical protein